MSDVIKCCPFDAKWQQNEKGCWQWTGAVQSGGYGNFRGRLAHRVSWETRVGKIPANMTIDHLCRNRLCVNPAHLRVVTQKENNLAGFSPTAINKRRTHCVNGHEFTPENAKIVQRKDGPHRKCRKCHSIYNSRSMKKARQYLAGRDGGGV